MKLSNKRTAASAILATTFAATLVLSGCSSDSGSEASSTPTAAPSGSSSASGVPSTSPSGSASASAAPTDAPPVFDPSASPSQAPDVVQPLPSPRYTKPADDPTWVQGADMYAWPGKTPEYAEEVLKQVGGDADKVTSAWKTVVIFTDQVGWNSSLMGKSADPAALGIALGDFLSPYALEFVSQRIANYEKYTKSIRSGENYLDIKSGNKKVWNDGIVLGGLISFKNPNFVEDSNGMVSAKDYQYQLVAIAPAPNNGLYVTIRANKWIATDAKKTANLKTDENGMVRYSRTVQYLLVPANKEFHGGNVENYPWRIDSWSTTTLTEEPFKTQMTDSMAAGERIDYFPAM